MVQWDSLKTRLAACRDCHLAGSQIVDPDAYPIFGRFSPGMSDVLFILESPNFDDTFNPEKRFLTVGAQTDPSGQFLYELVTQTLRIPLHNLQVTNAVLCLPALRNGLRPVSSKQMHLCSSNLREQLEVLNPTVVVTLGGVALKALRLIDDHGHRRMMDAVGQRICWFGRWLVPLYHTGIKSRIGRWGRSTVQQREDWIHLRRFLDWLACNSIR